MSHTIFVEKSQLDPNKPPWYWLTSDTYPHRELLKRWGCRWSVRRKAWYFVGEALPEAMQQLVDECDTQEESTPESQQPPDDDGLELIPDWLVQQIIAGRDTDPDKQMVYAKLFTPDADWTLFVRDYVPRGQRIFCYAILNGDLQMAEWGWQTLEDLQGVRGRLNLPMERDTSFRPESLDEAIEEWKRHRGLADDDPSPVMKPRINGNAPEVIDELELDPETGIRVIQPPVIPEDGEMDAVQTAIQNTKKSTPVSTVRRTTCAPKGLVRIPHTFCGELTGSISGNVWCYGYAIHNGTCVYVNMGGPRMAVEAIRAKMSQGDIVNCVPWDAPSVELTAGNAADGSANTGMYSAYMQNIPEAKFTSLILLHDLVTQPNYGGDSTTFLFHVSDEQAMAQLRHHVTKLVKVPVFDPKIAEGYDSGVSVLPMGSVFEHALGLLLGILVSSLMCDLNLNSDQMFTRHANLE